MTVGQTGQLAEALAFFCILFFLNRQLDFQLSNQYSGWAFSLLVLRLFGSFNEAISQLGLDKWGGGRVLYFLN